MADAANIQNLLAALAAQRPATTPTQTPPTAANHPYPPPSSSAGPQASYQAPPPGAPGYGPGPGAPGIPAPSSSGNLDLSAVRPVNSGTLNFSDTLAKVRAAATNKGVTGYDRPLVFSSDRGQDRPYQQSRSRSRSPSRNAYNDRPNPYRDERRGGHGRDYGRDRSYSPGPRGGAFSPRAGRDRSPPRGGGDEQSEIMQIESSLVGLIIGRQGENLRRIEADYNCRVQFLPAVDGASSRQCKISGPRHRREDVKAAINQIIDDSGMAPLNRNQERPRDANKGGAASLRDGEDHIQIMVPDRTVGLIIGRGGETIRDLQERSGCHINIVGENKSVNGLRPVNLIGTPEAAARAKDAIMEIVDSDSRGEATGSRAGGAPQGGRNDQRRDNSGQMNGGGQDKINDSVYVPSEAVGMIIGKGGETIREMQSSTGCKINVSQSSGPGETEREINLIGSQDAISRAKAAIEEKVDAVRQKQGGGGGGGNRGRGRNDYDHGGNYGQSSNQHTDSSAQAPAGGADDPYAQYGGYQNYVALWYQSLMYQQQQGGASGSPAPGAPAPGS